MVLHLVGEYVIAFLFKTLHYYNEGFFVLYNALMKIVLYCAISPKRMIYDIQLRQRYNKY